MSDGYKGLIKSNPDETEIRSFLVEVSCWPWWPLNGLGCFSSLIYQQK